MEVKSSQGLDTSSKGMGGWVISDGSMLTVVLLNGFMIETDVLGGNIRHKTPQGIKKWIENRIETWQEKVKELTYENRESLKALANEG